MATTIAPGALQRATRAASQAPSSFKPITAGQIRLTDAKVRQLLQHNPEADPWTYYDNLILAASAFPGNAAAVNYAQWAGEVAFFSSRTVGTAGVEFCNLNDPGQFGADFVALRLGVYIGAGIDAPAAAGSSASIDFVQTLVNHAVLELKSVGQEPILQMPVSALAPGEGPVVPIRVQLQAVAADLVAGYATNGVPSAQAVRYLARPLVFRADQKFTCKILTPTNSAAANGPLQKIVGLTALSGNHTSVVRVFFEGFRGGSRTDYRLRGVSLGTTSKK